MMEKVKKTAFCVLLFFFVASPLIVSANSAYYSDKIKAEEEALRASEQSVGQDQPDVAMHLVNLGLLYKGAGDYSKAEILYKKALTIYEKTLGPNDPRISSPLDNLAGVYKMQGKLVEAEILVKKSLEILENNPNANQRDVATSLNNLGAIYDDQGKYSEAEAFYKRALETGERAVGPDNPDVAIWLNNLAMMYKREKKYNEAEPLYKRTLAIMEKAFGRDHPSVATVMNNLGDFYDSKGNYAEAESFYKQALEIDRKVVGNEHPDIAIDLNNLAELYRVQKRCVDAIPLYKQALAVWEKSLGPDHPNVATVLENMAACYRQSGKEIEAWKLEGRASKIRSVQQWKTMKATVNALPARKITKNFSLGQLFILLTVLLKHSIPFAVIASFYLFVLRRIKKMIGGLNNTNESKDIKALGQSAKLYWLTHPVTMGLGVWSLFYLWNSVTAEGSALRFWIIITAIVSIGFLIIVHLYLKIIMLISASRVAKQLQESFVLLSMIYTIIPFGGIFGTRKLITQWAHQSKT